MRLLKMYLDDYKKAKTDEERLVIIERMEDTLFWIKVDIKENNKKCS